MGREKAEQAQFFRDDYLEDVKRMHEIGKQKILIVDDSEMNRFILTQMLREEYDILEAGDGLKAIEILEKHANDISLVLLDIIMPGMDGFGVLDRMNDENWIEDIPVIIISSDRSPVAVERAYELRVADFINRPFDAAIVRHRVVNTILLYARQKRLISMVERQVYEKERQSGLMIDILSHIVEFRNGESGLHVVHIRALTEILLKRLVKKTTKYRLTHKDITLISTASALHDIGKIVIPEQIINKPGRLTEEEFAIMKTHAKKGADMLGGVFHLGREPLLDYARDIAHWHHERYDGRGYPDGLKGDDIPICAQVTAMADVYDALTSERVYKKAFSHETAINMIKNGECGAFNPILLDCLLDIEGTLRQELRSRVQKYIDRQLVRDMTNELIC